MKKRLLIILSAAIMIVLLAATAMAAPPAESDFTFDSSTGTITGYTGNGGDVEIPATIGSVAVKSIDDEAFMGCENLTNVTVLATEPPTLGNTAFANIARLNVPCGSEDAYKANTDWSSAFYNIVGHRYSRIVCNNNGTHTFMCMLCDDSVNGHTKTEPCDTDGEGGKCSVCEYKAPVTFTLICEDGLLAFTFADGYHRPITPATTEENFGSTSVYTFVYNMDYTGQRFVVEFDTSGEARFSCDSNLCEITNVYGHKWCASFTGTTTVE